MERLASVWTPLSSALGGLAVLALTAAAPGSPVPDWENPEVFGRNEEPAHCTLVPYPDEATALVGTREASPLVRVLNGRWRFHWVRKPADRPVGFQDPGYDVSGWDEIPVPSNWELPERDLSRRLSLLDAHRAPPRLLPPLRPRRAVR